VQRPPSPGKGQPLSCGNPVGLFWGSFSLFWVDFFCWWLVKLFFRVHPKEIHAMRRTVLALAALCCIGTVHAFAPAPLVLKSSSQSRSSGRTGGLIMQLHTPVERRSLLFKTASLVVLSLPHHHTPHLPL